MLLVEIFHGVLVQVREGPEDGLIFPPACVPHDDKFVQLILVLPELNTQGWVEVVVLPFVFTNGHELGHGIRLSRPKKRMDFCPFPERIARSL